MNTAEDKKVKNRKQSFVKDKNPSGNEIIMDNVFAFFFTFCPKKKEIKNK